MDISSLVKILAPCLPFLMKIGNKVTEKATQKISENTLNIAKAIWAKLQPKVEEKEAAKEASIDVANNPEDEDYQAALRVQLKKILESNPELATEIKQIIEEKSTGEAGITNIIQNVDGNENQVIGNNSGTVINRVNGDSYINN